MPAERAIPDQAIALVKSFEGCHLEPYRDVVGLWTIGWGHLVTREREAERPERITQAEADTLLFADLRVALRSVSRLITASLNDGQLSALLSFTFNLGGANLQASTLRRLVNRTDYQGAADEFPKWRFAGGREFKGLLRRRLAERAAFLS